MKKFGHIQCHEHIYLRKGASYDVNPALCMDDYEKSLNELKEYKEAGGDAIIDSQPEAFGGDREILRKLSEESGVEILTVTGFHKLGFLEEGHTPEELTKELFVRELGQGADLIKIAYTKPDDPTYRRLTEEALAASAGTGAPITVHTEKDADPNRLIDDAESMGAGKMMLCHLDRTFYNLDFHKKIASRGVLLCYDSVHRYKYVSEEQEIALIKGMLDAGFEDSIVLSLDTTNQRLRSYNSPDMGLDYILREFIPALRKAGVTKKQIDKMCKTNAARFLERK